MLEKFVKIGLAVALAASTIAVPNSAYARDRHHDRHDDAALVIGAGIVGLAIGAAIASDHDDGYYYRHRHYYRDYPDRYYYYDRYPRRYYHDYRRDRWYDGYRWYDNRRHERHHRKHRRWRD